MYQHVVKISDYTMGNYKNILKAVNVLIFLSVINGQSTEQSISLRSNKENYELVYAAKTWLDAKEACESGGLQLAVPESQEEFHVLQSYVRSMKYSKIKNSDYHLIAWVGVSRLNKDHVWRTISGQKLSDNGFSKFSSHVSDLSANSAEPQCAGVDAKNIGFRDWWCNQRLPYICKKSNISCM